MGARVAIVSPYRGNTSLNLRYALACATDSTLRGESPFASHVFYTAFLDDAEEEHRAVGMRAGRDWMLVADLIAVYEDLGYSSGMQGDIEFAKANDLEIRYRKLPPQTMAVIYVPR